MRTVSAALRATAPSMIRFPIHATPSGSTADASVVAPSATVSARLARQTRPSVRGVCANPESENVDVASTLRGEGA